ncbi:hypothetical protein HPB50_028415 [Hyalomma asiaticum]|nr:hypothetical protein HPB50_028415 [Hyalomma asiaticum]
MVVVVAHRTAVDLLWYTSSSSYSGDSPPHKRRSSVCFIACPDGTGDDVSSVSGNNTIADAISGCWDHMAEPRNNIDGRCACVGHRGIPSRRRECDVVLETGVKASACLRNATRHTGAIQGTLRQPVLKSRSARRPRMSSGEEPQHCMEVNNTADGASETVGQLHTPQASAVSGTCSVNLSPSKTVDAAACVAVGGLDRVEQTSAVPRSHQRATADETASDVFYAYRNRTTLDALLDYWDLMAEPWNKALISLHLHRTPKDTRPGSRLGPGVPDGCQDHRLPVQHNATYKNDPWGPAPACRQAAELQTPEDCQA